MPTSFDSDSVAIARLNARVEAMGTRIAAMEEKQSSDMLQVFSAIEQLARSIDNLKSSVKKIPNPHDQPIRQNLIPLVPTPTENEEVISAEFGSNHQRVSLETVGKSHGVMKSEIIFCDLNGLVDFTSDFVTKMAFVGSLCPTHPFKIVTRCMKPPPKPPDVIKLDETLELKLSFCASYLFLNLCSPSVCKSALMVWPSHSSIQMDSVGGFNCISHPKIETTFVKPPAKPPDDFFICAPLDVKVWIEIATSYTNVHPKSCDMIFECLSFNMCEFDLKKSGGGSGLEDKNEPVCLNMVLYKGNEKEFAVKKIFLMILMKMKVIAKPPDKSPLLSISHKSKHLNIWISSLQTKVLSVDFSSLFTSLKPTVVEKAIELEFGVPFSIFTGYLHLCISYVCEDALQTFFPSSDVRWTSITSHNISCRSNDIVQSIWSWVGKPFWLPTDDTGYFILWHGWLTKVGNFVLECLDMADFTLLLKHDELIPSDFAHKIKGRQRTPCLRALSGFEVFLIVLDPAVTHRLNLNPICKHVIDHVMWFNGAHEDEVHVQEVLVPCSGALLVQMIAKKMFSERVVAAALCRVLVNVLYYCRYLLKRHIDLILKDCLLSNKHQDMVLTDMDFEKSFFIEDGLIIAGFVGYFEAGSTKLDKPMIMVWSGEVIIKVKGFAKFLFCKEQGKLKHDIIIIRIDTEGTSPSNFSFTFGIAWADKGTYHFSCRVILRVQTCLTHDSEAVKHLERNGLKRHYNSVMRCLSDSISFISSGCYIDPLILKAKSTWTADWYFQFKGTIEFMVTLQRIEKDGQIFGIHGLHILCSATRQMRLLVAYGTTLFSCTYGTMDWELDKVGHIEVLFRVSKGSLAGNHQTNSDPEIVKAITMGGAATAHRNVKVELFHGHKEKDEDCGFDRAIGVSQFFFNSQIIAKFSNGVRLKDTIVLPYKDNLLVCSVYLQHVFMELPENKLNMDGKMVCQGPLVHGNKGSTDQYAFVQQQRGVHNLFATFMEVLHGFLTLHLSLLDDFWKWALAWIFASISMHCYEFLLFSLPRPPEADDLEDKVDFKGRGMMRIYNVGFGLAEEFVMTKAHIRIVKNLLV